MLPLGISWVPTEKRLIDFVLGAAPAEGLLRAPEGWF